MVHTHHSGNIRWAFVPILLGLLIFGFTPAFALDIEDKIEKDLIEEIKVGDVPPDFTGVDMDGNEFTLSEMAGDLPIVLDFWATWCGPCRMEFPLLNEFQDMYPDEVMVVAITSEAAESEQAILDYLDEEEIIFRIIHDPSRGIIDKYMVTGIPHVVVIDTAGEVVAIHVGYDAEIIGILEEDLGL